MSESSFRDIAIKVAGAVAAGIGVLGFVALVGGADYWLRFSSAGLPADETVADLSNSQLLVLGTRELFPFLAVLVVEAIVLYIAEQFAKGKMSFGPLGGSKNSSPANNGSARDDPVRDPAMARRILKRRIFLTFGAALRAVTIHWALALRATLLSLLVVLGVAVVLGHNTPLRVRC